MNIEAGTLASAKRPSASQPPNSLQAILEKQLKTHCEKEEDPWSFQNPGMQNSQRNIFRVVERG